VKNLLILWLLFFLSCADLPQRYPSNTVDDLTEKITALDLQKIGKSLINTGYEFPLNFFDKLRLTKAVIIKNCHDAINFFLKLN
jgi:hypothetical protein